MRKFKTMVTALAATTALVACQAAVANDQDSATIPSFVGDIDPQDWLDTEELGNEGAVAQVGFFEEESACDACYEPASKCSCGHGKRKVRRECIAPWWAHRTSVFGEFLYLRPGSSDLIYATEQTDPDPTVASPTGPIGMTSIEAEGGFRVGFSLAASECSSIVTSFARWDGSDESRLEATGANVLDSNLIHPSTLTSGAASLEAIATHEQSFQTVDIAFRHLWKRTDTTSLNWILGARYGNIEQRLSADQTVSVATGLTNVSTDIDFNGFGITGGADFEAFSCGTGLSLYGKALASLLAGEWNATYRQTNQFGGGVIANSYEDFHATPVLDAELGFRWTGKKRHLMLSTGFLMSAWYDTVTTRSYIDAVRNGELTDAGETQTFSGLTARAEWRF